MNCVWLKKTNREVYKLIILCNMLESMLNYLFGHTGRTGPEIQTFFPTNIFHGKTFQLFNDPLYMLYADFFMLCCIFFLFYFTFIFQFRYKLTVIMFYVLWLWQLKLIHQHTHKLTMCYCYVFQVHKALNGNSIQHKWTSALLQRIYDDYTQQNKH